MGVSISTLQRLEAGDPTISIGIIASALWLMSREGAIGDLAAPANDRGALEMAVRDAEKLGRERSRASQESRMRGLMKKQQGAAHAS